MKVQGIYGGFRASGTIGDVVTAREWKGISYICQWFIPHNPKTAGQITVRNRVTKANVAWGDLVPENKALWDDAAKGMSMSGWNLFCSKYVIYMRDNAEAEPVAPFLPS